LVLEREFYLNFPDFLLCFANYNSDLTARDGRKEHASSVQFYINLSIILLGLIVSFSELNSNPVVMGYSCSLKSYALHLILAYLLPVN
jgi:hypothetical protein